MELKRQLGMKTATLIVVASMIGTGIFITTGTVLGMTYNAKTILILWVIGGIVAITGSLCYAELATMWPHVGGEYIYLKKMFGLLPSFLTGWISLVVGFSASIATSAITFVQYIDQFSQSTLGVTTQESIFANPWVSKSIAACVILFLGAIHIHGVKTGSRIQNALTVLKLIIIVSLIGFGLYFADWTQTDRLFAQYTPPAGSSEVDIPVIGLVLLIIMFSFSGWNGASYIAGEIKNPAKFLPKALFFGTLLTLTVYLLLNVVFLMSAPGSVIMGKEAIGAISSQNLFGKDISGFYTLGIAIILLSSISVQMMIGPRVYFAMAKDKMLFKMLSRINPRYHSPSISIVIQILLAIIYVYIGNAKSLMEYMGFSLSIFPVLTVIGLIYMRVKHPDIPRPYKVPLYPWVPLIFIILSIGMMIAALMAWTYACKVAIIVVLAGIPVYYIWRKVAKSNGNLKDIENS